MDNNEIVRRLKVIVAELDMIALELEWREKGVPDLLDMDWSVRVRNVLEKEHITSLRQLTELAREDLMRIPHFGRISLKEVENNLASLGLSLAPSRPAPLHIDWRRQSRAYL